MTKVYAVSPVDMYGGKIRKGERYKVDCEEGNLFYLANGIIGRWEDCAHLRLGVQCDEDWERVEVPANEVKVYAASPIDVYDGDIKAGEWYEVTADRGSVFEFCDSSGAWVCARWEDCPHLGGQNWLRIEVSDD